MTSFRVAPDRRREQQQLYHLTFAHHCLPGRLLYSQDGAASGTDDVSWGLRRWVSRRSTLSAAAWCSAVRTSTEIDYSLLAGAGTEQRAVSASTVQVCAPAPYRVSGSVSPIQYATIGLRLPLSADAALPAQQSGSKHSTRCNRVPLRPAGPW
jgi:hypothetical protein